MERGQRCDIRSSQLVDRGVSGGSESTRRRGADALGEIMRFGHRLQLVAATPELPNVVGLDER